MKSLDKLADVIDQLGDKIEKRTIKGLEKSAQQIYEDVVELAPGNGDYKSSIKIYPTQKENNTYSILIGTDMQVGPTIHGSVKGSNNAPKGTTYNLGYLLEHGTYEHAIPNAFGYGFYFGFTTKDGKFHKGTLDDSWHPGSIARPHFSLALEKNKKLIKKYIVEEWRQ